MILDLIKLDEQKPKTYWINGFVAGILVTILLSIFVCVCLNMLNIDLKMF